METTSIPQSRDGSVDDGAATQWNIGRRDKGKPSKSDKEGRQNEPL